MYFDPGFGAIILGEYSYCSSLIGVSVSIEANVTCAAIWLISRVS